LIQDLNKKKRLFSGAAFFYINSTKRTEWLEQPSAEELASMIMNDFCQDLSQVSPLKREKEADTL